MPRVIISSGHTESEPGSKANGLVEYEVGRKIAKKVLPHLRQNGIITLSVPPNLDLLKRLDWINNTGYDEATDDIAVEIHINEGGKRGVEVWYEGEGRNNSQKLSDLLLKDVSESASLPKQGSNSEYDHEFGSIAFLHDANPVTALIECCYIDNPEDAGFLKNEKNLEKLAVGITKGILDYYGIEYKKPTLPDTSKQPPVQEKKGSTKPTEPKTASVDTPKQTLTPTPPKTSSLSTGPISPAPPAQTATSTRDLDGSTGSGPALNAPYKPPSPGGLATMGGSPSSAPTGIMTREDRKKMIDEMYGKILGRKPTQNDLNYFLNIGINETDLILKMIDSQEHADIVKSRQEEIKIKQKYQDQQAELQQLRTSVEDQKIIIRNLHALIAQKNEALSQIQYQLNMMNTYQQQQTQPGQEASPTSPNQPQTPENSQNEYKGTFLDKLFKAFSDLFE